MADPITQFKNDYHFLSNFHRCDIVYQGDVYPSSEHLYQAMKTTIPKEREWVRQSETPGQAKKRGKLVPKRPDWNQVKVDYMRSALLLKFSQNPELADRLIDTGKALLVEGNYWGDTYWGVSLKTREGKNHLGILLMEVRDHLGSFQTRHEK